MKTQEEIENLAEQYWDKQPYNENAYVVGYIQCQQDMSNKKYTEEDMFKLWTKDILYCDEQEIPHEKKLFKDFINSLNKQN